MDFNEFKNEILADGIIDADEITKIEATLYEDGKIDQDEADFMFSMNDAIADGSAKVADDADWKSLFVKAISDYVLQDEDTPGVVDADEATYLIEKIGGDGKMDPHEAALLQNIRDNAQSYDDKLNILIGMLP